MPQRTGRMDGRCAYCNKKMWINDFLGGEVVCNKCSRNNDEFLFKKHHFYDYRKHSLRLNLRQVAS